MLAVPAVDLEAAGVVERPAGEAPLGRKLRMMVDAGQWDTGRLRVQVRRGAERLSLEFLVVSVDAGTELSRYNARREKRSEPLPARPRPGRAALRRARAGRGSRG